MESSRKEQMSGYGAKVAHPSTMNVTVQGANTEKFKAGMYYFDAVTKSKLPMPEGSRYVAVCATYRLSGMNELKDGFYEKFYSNEIPISTGELTKHIFTLKKQIGKKGQDASHRENSVEVMKGYYHDIQKELPKGCRLHKVIYCVSKHNTIYGLEVSGASMAAFISLENDKGGSLLSHAFRVNGFSPKMKGSISYSVPNFEWLDKLTEEESSRADNAYQKMFEYFTAKYNSIAYNGTPELEAHPDTVQTDTATTAVVSGESVSVSVNQVGVIDEDLIPF